jgi:hypothetical protein
VVIVETELPRRTERDFDAAVELTDIRRVTRTQQSHRRPKSDLARVRRQAYSRAAILLKDSAQLGQRAYTQPNRVLHEFAERTDAEYVVVPSWTEGQSSRRSHKLLKGGDLVATAANFAEGQSIRRSLDPIISYGIRLQYSLDNGIPYLTSDSLNTIFVDQIPRASHDPLKPMRCAAFFGWVMLAPASFADYERAVAKIDRKLRAAKVHQ